jgi:hypothetical protein
MFQDTLIVYADGTPRTRHVTTNIAIDADEEAGTAVSRSYFTVLQALPGLPLQPIAAGPPPARGRDEPGVLASGGRPVHPPGAIQTLTTR